MTTSELIKIWAKIKQFFALKSDVNALNTTVEAIGNDLTEIYDLTSKKIKASVLPSYVDDVVDGWYDSRNFYKTNAGSVETPLYDANSKITPETGKIYVNLSNNTVYRWSGSTYIKVSDVDLTDYYTKSQIDTKIASVDHPDSGMTQEQADTRYVQKVDFKDSLDASIFNAKEVIYGFCETSTVFKAGNIDGVGVKRYADESTYAGLLKKNDVLYVDVETRIAYVYNINTQSYIALYHELTDAEINTICVIEENNNDNQEAEPEE